MISSDKEIDILERIQQSRSTIRQRDLARIIGLSLGMTNSILKRLAEKGLLKVKKVNNRNIQYVVSAKGMEEISRRSYGYLKRTIKNVVYYKEAIDSLVQEALERGCRRLVLVGRSDLDFIVEHFCTKHRLTLVRTSGAEPLQVSGTAGPSDTFVLYSENAAPPHPEPDSSASLRMLFLAKVQAPVAPAET
jgi:DNA-binding MarR family transcriptional regulator